LGPMSGSPSLLQVACMGNCLANMAFMWSVSFIMCGAFFIYDFLPPFWKIDCVEGPWLDFVM